MRNIFSAENCEQAVIRLAQGDMTALSDLYDSVGRMLFTIAYSILGDYQLAEDAAQETFLTVAQIAGSYRKNTNARAWVAGICRNIAIDKSKEKQRELLPDEAIYLETAGFDYYDTGSNPWESALDFESLLEPLNPEEREIVVLKIVWGFKHSEIAELLNITTENCRQKYRCALQKVKNYFKEGSFAYE